MSDKLIDFNKALVHQFVETLRPKNLEIRKQVDVGYRFEKNSFFLFHSRPFIDDPTDIKHYDFAKIRYYKSKNEWSLYWKRANGKWELYDPFPIAPHLDEMLQAIKEDRLGCFFG